MTGVLKAPLLLRVTRSIIKSEHNTMLLVQRAATDNHLAGYWEFPGGKVDRFQTLQEAQKRENFEETGLLVEPIHPLTYTLNYVIQDGKYRGWIYDADFTLCQLVGGKLKLSHEHDAHRWATYDEVMDLKDEITQESWEAAIQFNACGLI